MGKVLCSGKEAINGSMQKYQAMMKKLGSSKSEGLEVLVKVVLRKSIDSLLCSKMKMQTTLEVD